MIGIVSNGIGRRAGPCGSLPLRDLSPRERGGEQVRSGSHNEGARLTMTLEPAGADPLSMPSLISSTIVKVYNVIYRLRAIRTMQMIRRKRRSSTRTRADRFRGDSQVAVVHRIAVNVCRTVSSRRNGSRVRIDPLDEPVPGEDGPIQRDAR